MKDIGAKCIIFNALEIILELGMNTLHACCYTAYRLNSLLVLIVKYIAA